MDHIFLLTIIAFSALTALLWLRINHWTHRALRAEAAVDRINAEIELHRIVVAEALK